MEVAVDDGRHLVLKHIIGRMYMAHFLEMIWYDVMFNFSTAHIILYYVYKWILLVHLVSLNLEPELNILSVKRHQ